MQSDSEVMQKKVDDFRSERNRKMAEYKKRIRESELLYEQLQNEVCVCVREMIQLVVGENS